MLRTTQVNFTQLTFDLRMVNYRRWLQPTKVQFSGL